MGSKVHRIPFLRALNCWSKRTFENKCSVTVKLLRVTQRPIRNSDTSQLLDLVHTFWRFRYMIWSSLGTLRVIRRGLEWRAAKETMYVRYGSNSKCKVESLYLTSIYWTWHGTTDDLIKPISLSAHIPGRQEREGSDEQVSEGVLQHLPNPSHSWLLLMLSQMRTGNWAKQSILVL